VRFVRMTDFVLQDTLRFVAVQSAAAFNSHVSPEKVRVCALCTGWCMRRCQRSVAASSRSLLLATVDCLIACPALSLPPEPLSRRHLLGHHQY
jgi:hypothetical protein